jgi:hypothetical protein
MDEAEGVTKGQEIFGCVMAIVAAALLLYLVIYASIDFAYERVCRSYGYDRSILSLNFRATCAEHLPVERVPLDALLTQ